VASSRDDLDLGELLGPDVTHYRDVLEGRDPLPVCDPLPDQRAGVPTGPAGRRLYVDRDPARPWEWQASESAAPLQSWGVPNIERFGEGLPDQASSCTELVPDPVICWDVCGYYAALGVPWRATRRELLEAYTAAGGPDSERLTYILKQLLRDGGALRRRYNRAPLGELFREDKDVELYLLRLAIRVGQARGTSQEDVLRGWGLDFRERVRADEGLEGQEKGIRFDADAQPEDIDKATASAWWLEDWGWYGLSLWNVPVRAGEILAEWQRLLAAEFSSRGVRISFAVGLGLVSVENPDQSLHIGPNGSAIFFIHTEQPKPTMASEAADGYQESLTSPQKGTEHA
jgi:hypothetical protein